MTTFQIPIENTVSVPMVTLTPEGRLRSCNLFHRSYDRLHSRCIEYPFTAACLGANFTNLLDIGSAKAAPLWLSWLSRLTAEVHCVDFDSFSSTENLRCVKADVRRLSYDNNTFERITAVSVIEHVGLAECQVHDEKQPETSDSGDTDSIKELLRVLKPGGRLVITVPFGINYKIYCNDARCYHAGSLDRLMPPTGRLVSITYFEYQHREKLQLLNENLLRAKENSKLSRKQMLIKLIKEVFRIGTLAQPTLTPLDQATPMRDFSDEVGAAVWRELPMARTAATNSQHIDGIVGMVLTKD